MCCKSNVEMFWAVELWSCCKVTTNKKLAGLVPCFWRGKFDIPLSFIPSNYKHTCSCCLLPAALFTICNSSYTTAQLFHLRRELTIQLHFFKHWKISWKITTNHITPNRIPYITPTTSSQTIPTKKGNLIITTETDNKAKSSITICLS